MDSIGCGHIIESQCQLFVVSAGCETRIMKDGSGPMESHYATDFTPQTY